LSDHGLEYMPVLDNKEKKIEHIFQKLVNKKKLPDDDKLQSLNAFILFELCKMYYAKGWTQQFHLGAMRNNNSRL
jgi:glucuronate isomerase